MNKNGLTPEQMMEESTWMTLRLHMDNFHDAEDAAADGVLAMLEAEAKADPEKGDVEHFERKSAYGAIHNFYNHNKKRRKHESVTLNALAHTSQSRSTDGREFIDLLPSEDECESYQKRREATENYRCLQHLVAHLPEDQREVIRRRFYLDQTLDVAGDAMGISKERVRQIEEKALALLRHRYEHAS